MKSLSSFLLLVYSLPKKNILLAMSLWAVLCACARAFVHINIKLQNGCQTIGMFWIWYGSSTGRVDNCVRERNKQTIYSTDNDNRTKKNTPIRTHKYEPNEIERKSKKNNSQLTMILNGPEQWQLHTLTHHFTRQYFSTPINLNLFWFVKYKNFILICCHAYLSNKNSRRA